MMKSYVATVLFIVFASILFSCSSPQTVNAFESNAVDTANHTFTEIEANWPVSKPEDQHADSGKLNAAHTYIQSNLPEFHSLLIVKNGNIIFENYYSGFNNKSLNNIKSCTKSITSILVGIAIDRKLINNTDSDLNLFYPENFVSPDVGKITIWNLLTMTTGFEWEDNGSQMDRWWKSDEMVKNALALSMVRKPGEVFNYCSPASHLLSGIITKASGMSTFNFAYKYLFKPLGIETVHWDTDRKQINYGFGELSMTSRDMAKIGYLYLCNGIFASNRIVSEDWVKESTQEQIKTYSPIGDYGYSWWISSFCQYRCYFAAGWGGQHIFVLPALDLVVIMTQDWNPKDTTKQHNSPFLLMNQFIIPAME